MLHPAWLLPHPSSSPLSPAPLGQPCLHVLGSLLVRNKLGTTTPFLEVLETTQSGLGTSSDSEMGVNLHSV